MGRLASKRTIVTGAASGIGKATALRLAQEGALVACTDIQQEAVEATAQEIRDAGGTALALACDVSDFEAVKSMVAAVVAEFGGLDTLVNVAGTGGFVRTEKETLEHWQQVIGVNLSGPFHTIRASIDHLLESKGSVVNVASIAGVRAHPYAAAYCASKGGLVMMTKALAMEYGGSGVRFNAVCPGGIKTPLLKKFSPQAVEDGNIQLFMRMSMVNGRYGKPEEMASTVAYVASDEAGFMTGSVLVNDGGSTL